MCMHKNGKEWWCVEQNRELFSDIRGRGGLAMYASTEPLPKKAVHFFDIGAVKVVHFKNSDKCEHSLTLRVALSWLRLI